MEAIEKFTLVDRAYGQKMQWLLRGGAALGLAIYLPLLPALALWPKLGLRLLWFLFIPIAPMFLLAAPNAWVSLCPISTVQTLARRFGWKRGKRLSRNASRNLQLFGWTLMLVGIPTRHLIFNTNGAAVFAVAATLTLLAFVIGISYLTLSGWCMGACPIRPVEVLYGQFALDRNRPENCMKCDGCVPSCVRIIPEEGGREIWRQPWARTMAYGFPGFVAAYFLLDLLNLCTAEHAFFGAPVQPPSNLLADAAQVYAVMALGFAISFIVFRRLEAFGLNWRARFKSVAVAAYSFYYLGVVPEIVEAWSLNRAWGFVLVTIPFAVLAMVLFLPRRLQLRNATFAGGFS